MTTKILVIIDPQQQHQLGFDRAIELANIADISMHVVIFTDGRIQELPILGGDSADSITAGSNYVRKCQIWLEELVQPHIDNGLAITTEVKAFRRLYDEVIRVATQQDVMFVFKPMRHHSLLKRTLYSSTDWNLIRTCPFPLLLVNDARPLKGRNIIAAVRFGEQDADHDNLNHIIMSQAVAVSKLYESRIHVVSAAPRSSNLGPNTPTKSCDQGMTDKSGQDCQSQAVELAREFDVPEDRVTVMEGQAEVVVDKLAKQLDAGVVIVGTVARSGLVGLFIGNTAERVLEEISTDILVLKQEDFTSPV